jgi:hypothetical protein
MCIYIYYIYLYKCVCMHIHTYIYTYTHIQGTYTCCSSPAIRFDTSSYSRTRKGCCSRDHSVGEADSETLVTALKRRTLVCAPFKTSSDSDSGNIDEEVLRELDADEDGLDIGEANEEADVEDEADEERENVRALRVKNGLLGAGSIHARRRKSTKREVMKVRAGELCMCVCVCVCDFALHVRIERVSRQCLSIPLCVCVCYA